MKNSTDQAYLYDIQEAISKIDSYTVAGKESFLESALIQDAVIRNLEVIGEATKRLKQETKDATPHIPWRRVAGLRDILIHDYARVDCEAVWNVVEEHLPSLRLTVASLLQDYLKAP